MLRARCNICTEVIRDGAACCPCGHVYHFKCLNKWLNQRHNCPTCRESTSKAVLLFFDGADLNSTQTEDDVESLKSNMEDLKALLNQKDVEINCLKLEHKKELAKETAALQKQKECAVEEVRKQLDKKLQMERSTTAGLKKQLSYMKEKDTELAIAQSEASELRAEFLKLKRMKTLIDDHASDAEAMLQDLDSNSFPEVILQLITLKRKLEEKKLKCKQAIDTAEKIKKENILIKSEGTYREIELTKSKEHLKMAEEDIRRLEDENASYKKKLTAMEKAFASPSPRSSAIGRLIRESPAPMDIKRPRLSSPADDSENIVIAETPSPKPRVPEGKSELKSIAEESKVDNLLEILLDQEKYDLRIRPNYDGGPVVVTVGFYLLSINSINVVDMDFTFDVFLRQQWVDKRLDHGTNQTLYLSNHVNDLIWIPDSYFVNSKNGEMHDVTSNNVMIMLAPGGLVKYNARITIKAYCPMNLQDFPMDVQRCPITIESYGYSDTHITFRWETSKGMDFVPDTLQMHPQYILTDMELSQSFTAYVAANWTGVTATFVFERIYSYFIYHVYAPSVIVVILSWVGFVLPRDTPPARVTLAVTAVLTIVTILTMLNSSIAKVNYVKKIDVYLICCFLFVFASLVEYSIILLVSSQVKKTRKSLDENEKSYSNVEDSPDAGSDTHSSSLLTHSRERLRTAMFLIKTRVYTVSFVSALDDYSLYMFPAGFAIFNVVYWLDTFKWI